MERKQKRMTTNISSLSSSLGAQKKKNKDDMINSSPSFGINEQSIKKQG
jgi:hypothetical protein